MNRPGQTSWLWWFTLIIAGVSAGLVYYINQDEGYMNAQETISRIIMIAVVGIGICVISATSHWWMRR